MTHKVRRGRPEKYDWASWMDGAEHEAVHGEDFDCLPQSFALSVRYTARKHGLQCEVSVDHEEGKVYFTFLLPAA